MHYVCRCLQMPEGIGSLGDGVTILVMSDAIQTLALYQTLSKAQSECARQRWMLGESYL